MRKLFGMVFGILVTGMCSPALAQTFTRAPGWHLSPQAGTYTDAGVGSPTVVYRRRHDDFVMFFESMVAPPDADCTVGYWGISYATSPDGLSWTQAATQKLPNADGSYYECVAAHPYAVMDDNGDDIHVWFKGEQGTQACDAGNQPWGCAQYTGVGYAKFDLNLDLASSSASPVVDEPSKFGYPAVVRVDDTWYMMLAKYPSFYMATSSRPDGGWTMANGGAPVMLPGVTTWSQDELFNPALVCEQGQVFPFQVYFGGRNYGDTWPLIDLGGWGDGVTSDAFNWFVNAAPHFNWSGNDAWRHWDTLRVGDERLVWFSEKENGVNNIGFAYTTAVWDARDVDSRLCPIESHWTEPFVPTASQVQWCEGYQWRDPTEETPIHYHDYGAMDFETCQDQANRTGTQWFGGAWTPFPTVWIGDQDETDAVVTGASWPTEELRSRSDLISCVLGQVEHRTEATANPVEEEYTDAAGRTWHFWDLSSQTVSQAMAFADDRGARIINPSSVGRPGLARMTAPTHWCHASAEFNGSGNCNSDYECDFMVGYYE